MKIKVRVYEVNTEHGPFRFFADSKPLAVDHARQLSNDTVFSEILPEDIAKVRFVGWQEEGTL